MAALLATGALGPAAVAADVTPPDDFVPWAYGFEAHATDDALYFATGVQVSDNPRELVLVWRRTLHDTPEGVIVGNAHVIGTARSDGTLNPMIHTSDTAAIWSDGPTGRLMLNDAADTTRALTAGATDVPAALGGDWYVVGGRMYSVGSPTTQVALRDLGQPWPEWANYSVDVRSAWVSSTAVAWIEEASGYSDSGVRREGRRLYVQELSGTTLVGTPRMVAENLDTGAGGPAPLFVQVSDEYVVWSTSSAEGPRTVSWVPLDDAAAPVQHRDVDQYFGDEFLVDGARLVLDGTSENGFQPTRTDLATGTTAPIGPARVIPLDLSDATYVYLPFDASLHGFGMTVTDGSALTLLHRFPDVRGDSPFVTHIDELLLRGITTGYPDGTFRPGASVTREAMAAFLYRAAGEPLYTAPATSPFADVTTGHPFYDEICWLASEGITTGWTMPDGSSQFRPGQPVSREAMAAFLWRFAGEPEGTLTGASPFTDVSASHPFVAAITWLAESGISTGWSTPSGQQFRPGLQIERQAMAAFLVRFFALDR